MVGPSKILTVSYGTFSCTLEGFDDPFSTMKSIAEYFRDLAADDRYFGAEPPTPDAEMLHRIAEQEVQRRVEARVQEDGIVLRQLDQSQSTPAPSHVAPAPEPVVEPVAATAEPFEAAVEDADGSIAAKLSRIRAVVARSRPAEEIEDEFDVPLPPDPYSGSIESAFEDVAADDEVAPIADVTLTPAEGIAEHDTPDDVDADAEDLTAVAHDAEDPVQEPTVVEEEDHAPAAPAAADLASRIINLKRSEEHHADPVADLSTEADDDAPADLDVVESDMRAAFVDADAEFDNADHDESIPDDHETVSEASDAAGDPDLEELDEIDDEGALSDLAALDGVDEENFEPLTPGADNETAPVDAGALEAEETTQQESSATVDSSESEDDDTLAAVSAALADSADVEPTLAPAEEASEFVDEPAEGAEEIASDSADDSAGAAFEPETEDDDAFDRILEETNSKLDEDEGSRRRSAIAHLKAAVAATKADRALGRGTAREDEAAEEQSQYRADLAKVVRPRKPEDTKASSERPAPISEGASPLMLVSSQRVDSGVGAGPAKAVLPRRVNTEIIEQMEDPMAEGGTSFAEFAQQMGATELPDLLEAAAAYSAFVEGRREFSRPQLMRRVASFERETFTREAGLRSFGQLLRQGKIQKLKRGQFTITDETRFNPEARVAGE